MKLGLPIEPPFAPMEAKLTSTLPVGDQWMYEPKFDGFRCIAFRRGAQVFLQSKSGKPLGRYFPEIEAAVLALARDSFVLDGELVSLVDGRPSFETLQLRLHPARSRVERLAASDPATFIAFDLLVKSGEPLVECALRKRKGALEKFAGAFRTTERIGLSPVTSDIRTARGWLAAAGDGMDGVVAKLASAPYLSGDRSAMEKVKTLRTADCVVGGYRCAGNTKAIASLLLGFYEDGVLHYVGFTSSLRAAERAKLARELDALSQAGGVKGFSGRSPGGPSRWRRGKDTEWTAVAPRLVVEVEYNQASGDRFRHGTRFLRTRPDKAPEQCTFAQMRGEKTKRLPPLRRAAR